MSICYLNGEFLPLDGARISVLDRGFIFGDGIYEVIPVFDGRPFRLEAHLNRLAQSLDATAIANPQPRASWTALIYELIAAHPPADGLSIYVQVTRGVAARNHAAPNDGVPTVFGMATPFANGADSAPVAATVLADNRWQRCDIKATSLLPNVMARTAATIAGVFEAILIRDGFLTEGAASNVFVVHDGRIKTPPKSTYILAGITRDVVIEALAGSATAAIEAEVSRAQLLAADEIWLTSSTRDIVPVTHLDGKPVGAGVIGPVYRRAMTAYAKFKARELANTASAFRS